MRKLFFLLLFVSSAKLFAQDGYKTPPKEIMDLILVKPTPNVSIDDKAEWMLFTQSNSYPSIEELAQPELRIAGLRINPNNFAVETRSKRKNNFLMIVYLRILNLTHSFS